MRHIKIVERAPVWSRPLDLESDTLTTTPPNHPNSRELNLLLGNWCNGFWPLTVQQDG